MDKKALLEDPGSPGHQALIDHVKKRIQDK